MYALLVIAAIFCIWGIFKRTLKFAVSIGTFFVVLYIVSQVLA